MQALLNPITRQSELVRSLAWPGLGILANAVVMFRSQWIVGGLRSRLNITAPSVEPSDDVSEEDKAEWRRAFRAQTNCLEWFALSCPLTMVAAGFACMVHGPWAPRLIGVCSLLHAWFRFQVRML